MLIRQNGIRIATSTKMTPKWPGSNQIAARIAQPIEGNELSTGLIRSSTTASSQGTPWARNASPPPIRSAAAIETSTRQVDVNRCHRNSGVMNSSTSRRATGDRPGQDEFRQAARQGPPGEQREHDDTLADQALGDRRRDTMFAQPA